MMKMRLLKLAGTIGLLTAGITCTMVAESFVYETDREFVGTGDFDGDGHQDVVIVDRASGKYRIGYQQADGTTKWVNHRVTGVKDVSGVSIGKLFAPKQDGLVIAGTDANLLVAANASNPGTTIKVTPIPFIPLGPFAVVAVDVGGPGNSQLDDLYVGSIYNDPNPFKVSLLRNTGAKFEPSAEIDSTVQLMRANRLSLKTGGKEFVVGVASNDDGDKFTVEDLSSGKPTLVAEAAGVAKGSAYAVGNFRGSPLKEVVLYKRDEPTIHVRAVEEPSAGAFAFAADKAFDLGNPIRLLAVVPKDKGAQLLVIYGKGDSAEVFQFDGVSAPVSIQKIAPRTGDLLFGVAAQEKQFLLLSGPDYSKFSTQVAACQFAGSTNSLGPIGKLASMADSDDATVPEIHKLIVETLKTEKISGPADMKAYTNAVPGSQAMYAMTPIPGGEFTMGSPDAEAGRQADEGPQHKVKISPFWMGCYEITWSEYELFMYPDDEKKLRDAIPTQDYVNKISDAVTRPSKPYMEMSFGMGKDGYPAISMTQHAANKYCQWLSAKTGHFYRLPTEAEWEYACRAGTTTAYFFGDDPKLLADYAWFEQNADFKYQKVGKKKPNPWGLYDIHGNVCEWCLDQYEPTYEKALALGVVDPWNRAMTNYPHVARGGSFDDEAVKLRSSARRGSSREWKMRDPQLPKSIWWLTDAQFMGFRLVRPLAVPSPEQLQKYWTSGVEKD